MSCVSGNGSEQMRLLLRKGKENIYEEEFGLFLRSTVVQSGSLYVELPERRGGPVLPSAAGAVGKKHTEMYGREGWLGRKNGDRMG
ncbi:hypothetical protein FKM82_020207 [Ascaphus truei]